MDCHRFDDLVHPYLDGALDEELCAWVVRHSLGCTPCAAALHSLETVRALLRDAYSAEDAPPGFRERMGARMLDRFADRLRLSVEPTIYHRAVRARSIRRA